jgi:hypothetical protein
MVEPQGEPLLNIPWQAKTLHPIRKPRDRLVEAPDREIWPSRRKKKNQKMQAVCR